MSYINVEQEGGYVAGQHIRKSFGQKIDSCEKRGPNFLSVLEILAPLSVYNQMGLEGIVRECKYVIKWEKGIRRRSWTKSIVRGGGSKDGECMI